MPALQALFCLRLWVFGLVFVRYKALEIRMLCFFYAAGERNLGKLYFCKSNG